VGAHRHHGLSDSRDALRAAPLITCSPSTWSLGIHLMCRHCLDFQATGTFASKGYLGSCAPRSAALSVFGRSADSIYIACHGHRLSGSPAPLQRARNPLPSMAEDPRFATMTGLACASWSNSITLLADDFPSTARSPRWLQSLVVGDPVGRGNDIIKPLALPLGLNVSFF